MGLDWANRGHRRSACTRGRYAGGQNIYQGFLDELKRLKSGASPRPPLGHTAERLRQIANSVNVNYDWYQSMQKTAQVLEEIRRSRSGWSGARLENLKSQIDAFAGAR